MADAKDREKWKKVLIMEFMSSEESANDDNDGDEVQVVHPLPWRSTRVDAMFHDLDKHALSKKSPQSKHQMKRRDLGSESTRPQPQDTLDAK